MKKNQVRGEAVGNSKLTQDDVRMIRQKAGEMSQQALGDYYGVTQAAISAIVLRKSWDHIN